MQNDASSFFSGCRLALRHQRQLAQATNSTLFQRPSDESSPWQIPRLPASTCCSFTSQPVNSHSLVALPGSIYFPFPLPLRRCVGVLVSGKLVTRDRRPSNTSNDLRHVFGTLRAIRSPPLIKHMLAPSLLNRPSSSACRGLNNGEGSR